MNPEMIELYKELEPYLIMDNERCCRILKNDVPAEIKEKYEMYLNMEDDEIIIENIEDFKNTTL